MSKGIVIGSDGRVAWQIPLWYEAYREHCTLPVAMANYGMTARQLAMCNEFGFQVFGIEPPEGYTNLAKALAIEASPFEWTLWTDLDCEIRGSVEPVFGEAPSGFGVTRLGTTYTNAGVIVAERGNSLLARWAELCKQAWIPPEYEHRRRRNGEPFVSDEGILEHLLRGGDFGFDVFDKKWNRGGPVHNNEDVDCVIYHYLGPTGKQRLAAKHGITIGG